MPVGSNSFYPAAICQSDTDRGLVVALNGEKKPVGVELLTFGDNKGQKFLSQSPASGGRYVTPSGWGASYRWPL